MYTVAFMVTIAPVSSVTLILLLGFIIFIFFYREGYLEAVKIQLDRGCKITEPSGSNDDTALTLASWKGNHAICYAKFITSTLL